MAVCVPSDIYWKSLDFLLDESRNSRQADDPTTCSIHKRQSEYKTWQARADFLQAPVNHFVSLYSTPCTEVGETTERISAAWRMWHCDIVVCMGTNDKILHKKLIFAWRHIEYLIEIDWSTSVTYKNEKRWMYEASTTPQTVHITYLLFHEN